MSSSPTNEPQFQTVLGRGHCTKNTTRLTESITAELASEGSPNVPATKSKPRRTKKSKTTQNRFEGLAVEGDLDNEGSDYTSPSSSLLDTASDSDRESDVIEITNEELAHLLPSKTVPEQSNSRRAATTVTMQKSPVDLEDAVPLRGSVPAVKATKRNPIYHFYDVVQSNAAGQAGDPGDKHYKCYLGNRKVLTITRAMKSSLNGLIGHLKTHFPPMYRLYLILKSRGTPPTEDELKMAQGEKVLDPDAAAAYLTQLEQASANLVDAFNKQVNKTFETAVHIR
ncbi:hypothetical protein F4604DRAFT_1939544 [Suillus subluteus]|nr:hypothetical protein F4604DRAFT_1939544 [Suillus subluteus]